MFEGRGSHYSAPLFPPRSRGRGRGRGGAYPLPQINSGWGLHFQPPRLLGEDEGLSSSAKRRLRRDRQDAWWAASHPPHSRQQPHAAPAPIYAIAPASHGPGYGRIPPQPAFPITVAGFQRSSIAPRPPPMNTWARVAALSQPQLQPRQITHRLDPDSTPLRVPSDDTGWASSRVPTPSANWNIPANAQLRSPRSSSDSEITALEGCWRLPDYSPPALDTWDYPTPFSTRPASTDVLESYVDLNQAPDPTNLVANALRASLLLTTFASLVPPPIDAVTPSQQILLTNALNAFLAITRQLRICADEPLDPLPVADDVALRPDSGCVICYSRIADTVLMPCWHLTLCQVCIALSCCWR